MALEVVSIDLSGAGVAVLKTATEASGKVVRLHELVIGLAANGTVQIVGGPSLTGDINVAANGTLVIPYRDHDEACVTSERGHGMSVAVTGGAAAGYAIISMD